MYLNIPYESLEAMFTAVSGVAHLNFEFLLFTPHISCSDFLNHYLPLNH